MISAPTFNSLILSDLGQFVLQFSLWTRSVRRSGSNSHSILCQGHLYFHSRENGLPAAHSLDSFELTESPVECRLDIRFVSNQAIHIRQVRHGATKFVFFGPRRIDLARAMGRTSTRAPFTFVR
jgi:hypothetical protein